MTNVADASVFYVVEITTVYSSLDEAARLDPDTLARHIARCHELHERGELLMAGAFLDSDDTVETMAVTPTREAAEAFIDRDPFVLAGKVPTYRVRTWTNILARPG